MNVNTVYGAKYTVITQYMVEDNTVYGAKY